MPFARQPAPTAAAATPVDAPTHRRYGHLMPETTEHSDRALIATVITCSIALAALILAQTAATNAAIADIRSDMREDRAELIAAINRNGAAIAGNSAAIAELRAIVTGALADLKPSR